MMTFMGVGDTSADSLDNFGTVEKDHENKFSHTCAGY